MKRSLIEPFANVNVSHVLISTTDYSNTGNETIRIFTWLVYGIICQLIVVFGIITNIINIVCF
ncbi:unnamed protein product, partial [Candidula unifasciata]